MSRAQGKRTRKLRNLLHNVGGTCPWRSPQRPRHIMRAARVPPPTRMSAISPSEYSSKDFIGSEEERKKWHFHLSLHSHLQYIRRFSLKVSKSKCLGVWIFSSIYSLLLSLSRFIHTATPPHAVHFFIVSPQAPSTVPFILHCCEHVMMVIYLSKGLNIFVSSDLICWQTRNCK